MPQSSSYKLCALCGKRLGEWSWLHTEGVHVRSGVEETLTIVHRDCVLLVERAIRLGDPKLLLLMKG